MARDFDVNVEGLADLRRDLKRMDPKVQPEVNTVIKGAVSRVAVTASRTAPRQSGTLAASYRPFTRGNVAGVRSPLPYAPVIEYGGTIAPRGVDITFSRRLVVTRAVEQEADRIIEDIGDGLDGLAKRHGWHR